MVGVSRLDESSHLLIPSGQLVSAAWHGILFAARLVDEVPAQNCGIVLVNATAAAEKACQSATKEQDAPDGNC